ncbi:MAG: DUF3108 domain-containing protein [Leeuwenhoekiella sp.]
MMKKIVFLLVGFLLMTASTTPGQETAFEDGEWFRFRMRYGLLTAGYANLEVKDTQLNGKKTFHLKGFGETTGPVGWVFKVEDHYESYIDKDTNLPYRFIRKIDEGGHTKDKVIDFDQDSHQAHVFDKKHGKKTTVTTAEDVHDMISSFYYLRNSINTKDLKIGDETELDMFFDEETFKFKLKYLGRDVIKTPFGRVAAVKFRPYVQAGRVFKEKESLTIWISDDKNKIPLLVKADLAVGSLKAELDAYKGLKHPFPIIID